MPKLNRIDIQRSRIIEVASHTKPMKWTMRRTLRVGNPKYRSVLGERALDLTIF